MLKLIVQNRALCLFQVYASNATSEYEAFVDKINDALSRVTNSESIILLGDFNAHVGTDNETWANENGQYLLPKTQST